MNLNLFEEQCNKTVTTTRSNTKIGRFVRIYNGNEEDLRQALDNYGFILNI